MGGLVTKLMTLYFGVDNLETLSIVWLDADDNVLKTNASVYKQFCSITEFIHTFKEAAECEAHIRRAKYDRIILIVDGQLVKDTLKHIHDLKQVISIYVYHNKAIHEDFQWTSTFKKVKSLSTQLTEIAKQIKTENKWQSRIKDSLPITIAERTSSGIDGNFLHGQLLLEVLDQMEEDAREKKKLIELCRDTYKDSPAELTRVTEFEENYRADMALWWYTRESFVYRMVNNAFRTENIDVIVLFRSVIHDVENQLRDVQISSAIHVYRAQLMSEKELALLRRSVGELISINSFLSSTADRNYATFLLESSANSKMERVLFEIDANPNLSKTKPFADVSSHSSFPDEKEILFMAGSIFRLVNHSEEHGVHTLRMVLCGEEDHDLKPLFDHFRKEINQEDGRLSLVILLAKSGKTQAAKKQLELFLKKLTDKTGNVSYENHLLRTMFDDENAGDFDFHVNGLKFQLAVSGEQILFCHTPTTYNDHFFNASHYRNMGDINRALSSYEAAVNSYRQKHKENHENIARSLLSMGHIYMTIAKYDKALFFFQQSLCLIENFLNNDQLILAACHDHIGSAYCEMSEYDLALDSLEAAFRIKSQLFPPDHSQIAICFDLMGGVLQKKRDFSKALSLYKQAADIYQKSLPSDHPFVVHIMDTISILRKEHSLTLLYPSPRRFCFLLLISTTISLIVAYTWAYLEEL
ncbi:unnamed protein product [Adineta ricciae]|uniref:ADP ribosyltransferase domain-containing protein n=1 Tax=Adineta ricciae TaxID=249248 RepID=A0A814BMP4_ADIRI|nr:unnamed protein product [Adineta ricciae]